MSQLNAEHRLFINGTLVEAEGGNTYAVINPALPTDFARLLG